MYARNLGSGRFGVGSRHSSTLVIPAKAGIQSMRRLTPRWIPAFAGMTGLGDIRRRLRHLPVKEASGRNRAFVEKEHLRDRRAQRRGLIGLGAQEGGSGPLAGEQPFGKRAAERRGGK